MYIYIYTNIPIGIRVRVTLVRRTPRTAPATRVPAHMIMLLFRPINLLDEKKCTFSSTGFPNHFFIKVLFVVSPSSNSGPLWIKI